MMTPTETAIILMGLFLSLYSREQLDEVLNKKIAAGTADEIDLETKRLLDSGEYDQLINEGRNHE